jgi:hypothetical protein
MMSNSEHEQDDDAAVSRLADALRADVAVRPEWRNGVQREIDALSPPVRPGVGARVASWRRRPWVMSPLTGIAAALVCVAIGVAGAIAVLRPAAPDSASPVVVAAPAQATADAQTSPASGQSSGGTSVRFVIVSANATTIALVGDFNGWNPRAMPMERLGDGGAWVRDVVLEPGRHVYAFYVDGALQVDPSAPRAAEDDFGIPSSALVVRNASQ